MARAASAHGYRLVGEPLEKRAVLCQRWFGLKLSSDDKRALIEVLRTL